MALKTKTITITAEGRDKGKAFLLTEMPAIKVEAWAARLLRGLANAGVELPDDVFQVGIAAVIAVGARAISQIDWDDAELLMAEMLECIQLIPDPTRTTVVRPLIETDIEELITLLKLRSEVIELHTGFSPAAALSTLGAVAKESFFPTPTLDSSLEASSAHASRHSMN